MLFKNSGVALVTPMNDDFSINYNMTEELVEFQIANKTGALIVCGTTGEASTLSDEEQVAFVKRVAEITAGRIPVIAGTGSNDTRHGIELTKACENAGADAALIVTPYYNKTTQKGLIAHYKAIAENTALPIILYSIQGRTGLNMLPSTVYELSKVPNIVGIKEASGNISQAAEISRLCGDDFALYSGDDNQVLPLMSLGGVGVISVLANIAPRQVNDLCENFRTARIKEATAAQLKMLPLVDALFSEVNPVPIKQALSLMGKAAGLCRMPLTTIEDENLQKLKTEMQNYGLI